MIYLDNAATSWPKPPVASEAMAWFLEHCDGSPGRSGHEFSVEAARAVYDVRELVAELFNAPDPLRVVFTMNATHALNLALRGLLRSGDRVVTTGMEHNSMMRPLRALERDGVEVTVAACSPDGLLDMEALAQAVGSRTRLVAVNAASNVVGTLQNIKEVTRIAHNAGALVLVDAAQSAGVLPIDVQRDGIDLLAFTGHKGLLGPTGTGGLVIGDSVDTRDMAPLILGGTGSDSKSEGQPSELPDRFESGTPNSVGIVGLGAGIRFVNEVGIESIREREIRMTQTIIDGLASINRVHIHGTRDAERSIAVVSFTIDGIRVSEVGLALAERFRIMCRVGLHCAPSSHKTIGTFPEGTVRFAPGIFTTTDEIIQTLEAVREIAGQ